MARHSWTFEKIERDWTPSQVDLRAYSSASQAHCGYWRQHLGDPLERGWYHACRDLIESVRTAQRSTDSALQALDRWLEPGESTTREILNWAEDEAERSTISLRRAHLLGARAIIKASQHWTHAAAGIAAELRDELAKDVTADAGLCPGFLRALVAELCGQGDGEAARVDHRQEMSVLLVDRAEQVQASGVVATLSLERLHDGNGDLYPVPALSLVPRDEVFREAEQSAWKFVRRQECWKPACDVRWNLTCQKRGGRIHRLEGGSMGGAFALGLCRLLSQ